MLRARYAHIEKGCIVRAGEFQKGMVIG